MTKFATILTAAALALTISTAAAHEHTGPRVVQAGADTALILDGKPYQLEYLPLLAMDKAGFIDCRWWEDGSPYCE